FARRSLAGALARATHQRRSGAHRSNRRSRPHRRTAGANVMEIFSGILIAIVVILLFNAFRVLREYERGVVFQLGRFWSVKGPGLIILIPLVQQMVKMDLRTVVLDVPSQDLITRDNVSVKVNAVLYFRVVDPERAVINVEDYMEATGQLAQTTLR